MPKKRIKVHYRRLLRSSEPLFLSPLGGAIGDALIAKIGDARVEEDVRLRTYEEQDGSTLILNGLLISKKGSVFGELVRYDPNADIPLLMQSSERVAELTIKNAIKPNDAEFLRGMGFFLIRGDHIWLVDQDLSVGAIERYFRWLLFTQTRTIERDGRIQLVPRMFLRDDQPELMDVESITFSPPPIRSSMFIEPSRAITRTLGEGALETAERILRAAHFDTAVLERLTEDEQASVQVKVGITFKTGSRRRILDGEDALALLRHVPEDELILNGKSARKNRGILEHVSDDATIEHKGNILDRREAWNALEATASKHKKDGLLE